MEIENYLFILHGGRRIDGKLRYEAALKAALLAE